MVAPLGFTVAATVLVAAALAASPVSLASAATPASLADFYGDPGTGVASTTSSPYVTAMTRIVERELPGIERLCRSRADAAVVFDADDTTLLTYGLEVEMGFTLDRAIKNDWIRNNRFPAVPGMVKLVRAAQASGCRTYVITGRRGTTAAVTAANLAAAGYPRFTKVFTRTCATCGTSAFKSGTRAHIERAGFDIVANVGDQVSDFVGGHSGHRVKVPNPMYTIP